ncbi:MAG: sigma 54-interacting transcriptional regulator [Acidobacteria bacterium]|nr:sigma 54-interacting transcriptional regulator [Acidobacteriota bacterium]
MEHPRGAGGHGLGHVRRGDRRQGLHTIVRALATHLVSGEPQVRLEGVLEAGLARALGADWLRAVPRAGTATRLPAARAARVRTNGPVAGQDVFFELALPVRRLDAWDEQLLETAAHLLTLALAADRQPVARVTPLRSGSGAAPLIGSSSLMRAVRDRIERVATSDFTVLIQGESGTGKELVARQIHELSIRRSGPFVAVNCAALVETLLEAELFGVEDHTATGVRGRRGKFEHADGGTLFLDEVAELSIAAQAKLLRAIQDLTVERVGGHATRRLNVRIVAATNKPLAGLADRGVFRSDLYYRLSGLEVVVPPLRVRRDDILELAHYFLACHESRGRVALSATASDAIQAYHWPGNVRELQRTLEGAVAMSLSRVIDLDDLPTALRGSYADVVVPSLEANDSLRAWASRYAKLVLERSGHNKRKACRALGISYHTLQAHLRYEPTPAPAPEVRDDVA